jgi:diguanylate cyclase (GGDEF)-like protein
VSAIPTALERDRRLDLDRRLRPVLVRTQAICALSLLVAAVTGAPEDLPVAAAALAVAMVGFRLVERVRASSPAPERWLVAQQAVVTLPTAAFIAVNGGVDSPAAPILAMSAAIAALRFAAAGTAAVSAGILALVPATFVAADPAIVAERPEHLLVWVSSLLGVGWVVAVVARSDREARGESALDPLTGLLNRKALSARFDEVAAQARQTGEPVSLVVADLDEFKVVNDRYGHGAGDEALVAAAQGIRAALRSFDAAYRLGGDEFVVLLPGASVEDAAAIAARVEAAVAEAEAGGCPLSLTTGTATASGADVRWTSLFTAADRALYARKAAGRDREPAAASA